MRKEVILRERGNTLFLSLETMVLCQIFLVLTAAFLYASIVEKIASS